MENEQPSAQNEALKQSTQKAVGALGAYNNEAIEEQLSIAVERKIPNIDPLPLRSAAYRLKDALKKETSTATQLQEMTNLLTTAISRFKTQMESVKIDDSEMVQTATLQLEQYKIMAFDKQINIVRKEKIPVLDTLIDDLRNTHYNLARKLNNDDRSPLEIEALVTKMHSLAKRFQFVLEASEKDQKQESEQKRKDAKDRAQIFLRGYQDMNKNNRLALTTKEMNSLPEDARRKAVTSHGELHNAAMHLDNQTRLDKPAIVLQAMTDRLEELINKALTNVKAIREEQNEKSQLKKMDDYFNNR